MSGRSLASSIPQPQTGHKHPHLLNLENHKITHIGIVSAQATGSFQHLNLKNNCLKSIDGISQFASLESLDLSNNKISSPQSLFELKNLFHLKKLYLKGNPFLQNPLSQQVLNFLGGFQNDLSILNFAFVNESRQALINLHKRDKSQSKSQSSKISANSKVSQYSKMSDQSKKSDKSQIKSSRSQKVLIAQPKIKQVSNAVQVSKANILLKNMKQFIEQGHESQEMSSESIHGDTQTHQESVFINETLSSKHLEVEESSTPMKKSPRFRSFAIQDKNLSDDNQTIKFQEQSTGIKGRTLGNSKDTFIEELFSSNQESVKAAMSEKFASAKSPANHKAMHDFRKSPSKQYKYQVENLNIKMEMESVNMNCPSIIEKEDHDSYEIQFDFMSPERYSRKASVSPKASPAHELKQATDSYMKIQQEEITLNNLENMKKKHPFSKIARSPKVHPSSTKNLSNTLSSLLNRKQGREQSKSISKKVEKQNIVENIEKPKGDLPFSKRVSLYQSTKHLLPNSSNSTANELMNKLLMGRQKGQNLNDSISFSAGFSLEQMIENGQKFERFYYNSLTKLKPVFNLLYSPFSSLKTDEKDMLLQELFKNHKQIFILFIREYHAKQQLQDQLHLKDQQIDAQNQDIQQLNEKVLFLGEKLNQYNEKYHGLHDTISNLELQNAKYKKQATQFDDILAIRQKLINDVKLEYEKANKVVVKKDLQIQKFLNQDQVEEQIQKIHQKNIKKRFLALVNKKAQRIMKIQQFQRKRQEKHQRIQQRKNHSLKVTVFEAFLKNYHKEKGLKDLQERSKYNLVSDFFFEWKIEAQISKFQNQLQKFIFSERKSQFWQALCNFTLSKQRNRKIENFRSIRLKRKVFFQGFKKLKDQQQSHKLQTLTKAIKFNNKNLLKEYFEMLKLSKSISNFQREDNYTKIKPMIVKRQLNLFRRLVNLQRKEEHQFTQEVKTNVLKVLETKLMLKIMKNQAQKNSKFRKGLKIAFNYKLKKLFNAFKSINKKAIKKYQKMRPLIYKAAQEQRLKTLVMKFREGTLVQKVQKQQKQAFFESFHKFHLIKAQYSLKFTELQCFLNFRRGFKAKTNFISTLRHLNLLRRIKSKEATLSEHYQMQDMKYKEGHELNMFTLDQLKSQINTYLNEINCYKVQVQILGQRQQFLLDEKENCLLEMQSREEENLELKTILIENEKKLSELEKKYERSLDMYSALVSETDQKMAALERSKSSFLYDTIAGGRQQQQQATFRKEKNETTFTSLKR